MSFNESYRAYQKTFEHALSEYLDELDCTPQILKDSMVYSVELGGKRFRPVLMLAVGELLGVKTEDVMPFAIALELIHTYSLIHDDLPGMDNDDFRRGKPSNHKVFGEGNAILAGDALLNTAFEIVLKECMKSHDHIQAARFLAYCAGIHGMICGQSADMLFSAKPDYEEEDLLFIYENKTGKLIKAACEIPAILAGGKYLLEFEEFSSVLGVLFQLTDDILDEESSLEELGKSVGKDKAQDKLTAIKIYGLPACKAKVDLLVAEGCQLLEGLPFKDTLFLKETLEYIQNRKN